MKKYTVSALAAAGLLAGGLSVTSASAADLGGNCCADLEERIAELEATTARKGNRKVSLTISGWVGQQVMFWDDGDESNVYVHDLGTTLASNVKFTGQATISPGWSAGYVLHLEAISSDSLTHDQDVASGPAVYGFLADPETSWGGGVHVLQSYWFIKSDTLGKVSVGQQSQASDNTAILVDGSGSLVPANWVAFDVRAMMLKDSAGNVLLDAAGDPMRWGVQVGSCGAMGGAWGDCNGLTQNAVRYDSPTFAGFSVSASWGADDFWDVAARYAGEFAGFKVAAAVAYTEVSDTNYNNLGFILNTDIPDMDYLQAGLYIQHVGSGLFALVNYGDFDTDNLIESTETWYGKVGIRQRWTPLGHTVLYGEYLNNQDSAFIGDELEVWGGGIVQEIDNAAMSVWVKYRNLSYDDAGGLGGDVEDFDYVGVGGLINY